MRVRMCAYKRCMSMAHQCYCTHVEARGQLFGVDFFSFSLYMVSGERTQVASLVQCVIALRGEVSPVWALQEKVFQPFRSL